MIIASVLTAAETMSMEISSELGSAGWKDIVKYVEDDTNYQRVTRFFKFVKWNRVIERCSQVHDNVPCKFKGRYSVGSIHMVRHIVFDDGHEWVIRILMPGLPEWDQCNQMSDQEQMKSEIATMRFIRYVVARGASQQC